MTKPAIDKAFKLFHEKKLDQANSAFGELLKDEDIPTWFKYKIEQFKRITELRLEKKGETENPTFKDFSYLVNLKQYEDASALLKKMDISEADKLYLSAEMLIEQDQKSKAAESLKKAIDTDSANLGYALNSPSFSSVLNQEEFQFLRKDRKKKA